jgi:hypothetical protein
MLRRVSIIVFIVVVGVALPLLFGCGAASPSDFVGNWEETGSGPPKVMHIESSGDDIYTVIYRRFYPTEGRFRYADGELIYAPVSPEFTDVITHDSDTDTLTITSGNGHSYELSRVRP